MVIQGKIFILIFTIIASSMIFQNCGQFSTSTTQTVSGSCAVDLKPTFQSTYYSFFKSKNCNSCHSFSSNQNVPVFADDDASAAYAAFLPLGPSKISGKLSVGHQQYDYTSLKPELDTHFDSWLAAQDSCNAKTGASSQGQTMTFFKNVEELGRFKVLQNANGNAINTRQTITFDLGDSSFSTPIAGASLSFDIEAHYDFFFYPTRYEVSNPRFTTQSKAIHISGLIILLNGKSYQVTTFTGIDEIVPGGTSDFSLDPNGASTYFIKEDGEIYTNTDEWSIQLEVLEEPSAP